MSDHVMLQNINLPEQRCASVFRAATGFCASLGSPGGAAYDEKNIRRRVYDALNVLMAMDIITKDKKEISWQGLPTAPASQLERLKQERDRLHARIAQQQGYLKVRAARALCALGLAGSPSPTLLVCRGIDPHAAASPRTTHCTLLPLVGPFMGPVPSPLLPRHCVSYSAVVNRCCADMVPRRKTNHSGAH
jgi:hypothetical protein